MGIFELSVLTLLNRYKEDGNRKWLCFQGGIVLLAILIRSYQGVAVLIGGMLISGYLMSIFQAQSGIHILLSQDQVYLKQKEVIKMISAGLCNLFLGVFALVYIGILNQKITLIVLLYGISIYLFATGVGVFIGVLCKSFKLGFMICIIFIISNFLKMLVLEENFRYISPMVPLGNLNQLQWWNLSMSLLISACICIYLMLGRKRVWLIGGILSFIIITTDVFFSSREVHPPEQYQQFVEQIFSLVNEQNRNHGLPVFAEIKVEKSTYYLWNPASKKRVFYQEDDILYMNCFTESLCNLDAREMIVRMLYSTLKPQNPPQQSVIDLYVELILGNDEKILAFLPEEQEKIYGEVPSLKYALYADTLINTPSQFGKLYELVGELDSVEDIIEGLGYETN